MGYSKGIMWTKEMVHQEALKYKTRKEFQVNSSAACNYAKKKRWILEVCSHMVNLTGKRAIRTKEECHEVALKYDTHKDFKKKENGVYLYAKRRGWLNDIISHMFKKSMWKDRKEEVHQVALKYQYRGEFCLKDEYYYEIARRWGWLDEVCSHMVFVGHKYKRLVYVYEFKDKTSYIGLTGNDIRRSHSHKTKGNSPVYRHSQEMGLTPIKKIVTDGYIDSELARGIEHETIERYREQGWNVLNKVKAGGLGGSDVIWTEEKILETISKYKYESDFRKNEKKLVHKLHNRKEIKKYVSLLIKDNATFWNEELVKKVISEHTQLSEFTKQYGGARGWIRKNKMEHLLDGLISKNYIRQVTIKWDNKEEILYTASKYDNITMFRNENGGMYSSAKKNGWLDDIKRIILPKFLWTKDKAMEVTKRYTDYRTFREENKNTYDAIMKYGWRDCLEHLQRTDRKWTYDEVKEESLKYNSRNDFCKYSTNAYNYAVRNNLLNELCTHMKRKDIDVFVCSVCNESVKGKTNLNRWHEGNCNPNRPYNKNNMRASANERRKLYKRSKRLILST
jgi:hypothetical protein